MVGDMSNTATAIKCHACHASLLLKFRAQGMTFAEVTTLTGAVSADDLVVIADVFPANAVEQANFAAWVAA